MRDILGVLFGALLTIAAIMIGSVAATIGWQQEAEDPQPIRTVGVVEYRRGRPGPPSNSGKSIPSCPECSKYILTDYRHSPAIFGPNGLYKGHFEGERFIFDTPPTMDNLFTRTPPGDRGRP